jgi:hypothetical protein
MSLPHYRSVLLRGRRNRIARRLDTRSPDIAHVRVTSSTPAFELAQG